MVVFGGGVEVLVLVVGGGGVGGVSGVEWCWWQCRRCW